jgi:hypothetical protein
VRNRKADPLLDRFRTIRRKTVNFKPMVGVAHWVKINRDWSASKLLRLRNVFAVEVIPRNFLTIDFNLNR